MHKTGATQDVPGQRCKINVLHANCIPGRPNISDSALRLTFANRACSDLSMLCEYVADVVHESASDVGDADMLWQTI